MIVGQPGKLFTHMIAFVCVASSCFCHAKSGVAHVADITDILFNSERTSETKKLAAFISQGMDMGAGAKPVDLAEEGSSFLNSLRKEFGSLSGVGEHREFAHWGMSGSIPEEFLTAMEKAHPGSKERVVELWRQFVITRREAVKQALNLSGPNSDRAAHALASMMNDIHVLGDQTTKATAHLRTIDNVVNDYMKAMNRMLGNHNGLSAQIKAEIKLIPKGLSNQERAARILEILKSHNTEFSRKATSVLSRMGYNGDIISINYEKLRAITGTASTPKPSSVLKKNGIDYKPVKKVHEMGDAKPHPAKVKEIKVGGKVIKQVEVPVVRENGRLYPAAEYMAKNPGKQLSAGKNLAKGAMKQGGKSAIVKGSGEISKWLASPAGQGVSAGVLTFLIKEGEAVIAYSDGSMEADEFHTRTALNTGVAVTEGTVVYVISAALAEAPVVITVGALIIGGIAVEQAGEYVWYRIDREVGTFPGISVDELLYQVDEETRNRRTVIDDFKDLENGHRVTAPIPFSDIK